MLRLGSGRAAALRMGYAATDWREPMSFDAYRAALAGWELRPVLRQGVPIGAAFFKAGEVHVSILPAFRKRWATRGFLADLFAHAALGGEVKTRIAEGHEYMVGVMQRLGFVLRPDGYMVKELKNGN